MAEYQKLLGFVVEKRSTSPDPRYGEIRIALRGMDVERAMTLLEESEPSAPSHEWHFLRGCALRLRGDHVDSVYHLERAYALCPESREYWRAQQVIRPDAAWLREEKKRRRAEYGMECCCECCATGVCECLCESCDGCG